MSHFSFVRPLGIWVNGYVPQGSDFTQLDQHLFKAINGDDGGTWAPSTPVTIGGSGVSMEGDLVVPGPGVIDLSSTMNCDGTISVSSVGSLVTSSSSNVQLHISGSSTVTFESGYPALGGSHPGRTRKFVLGAATYGTFSPQESGTTLTAFDRFFDTSIANRLNQSQIQTGLLNAPNVIIPLPRVQGGTLTGSRLAMQIGISRSVVPANPFRYRIVRQDPFGGGAEQQLVTSDVTPPTSSAAAYYASGTQQNLVAPSFTSFAANLDFSLYDYHMIISDEFGTNAREANLILAAEFTFSVTDLRP